MAAFLAPKTASEVVRREWLVPIDSDDGAGTVALAAAGVTVDSSEFEDNTLVLVLSAGTAAATGSITATVTTNKSRTLIETLYIPIVNSPAQIADTARSYIGFALRKIVGIGNAAEATELDDALERLNAIVARWRAGGSDIGAPFPMDADSVIYCPDWAVSALRYNLLIECAPLFSYDPTALEYENARRGLQLVKHKNLKAKRKAEYY